ncbi:hypothetical protein [Pseudomonas syringae]|uniref:hypothetical protein n=2 Tax=Pseudomonas syringae TaxID=317 RepID=UPI001E329356|nr:hypothetical protein [Pseudomonas syringae]MCH5528046.1 hypothetical protein [Pseudomonas syringae pv. syringae]MCH5537677.1 hypothetical protein [Pseudomonas syringae pv. syringae]MCH5542692.1 hypothetical protein [Pseudomonas syringae pv. syringae]MCH5601448.1 hypothetical protein [Pseudomonas syringae pv. syringae]MCH5606360.1 hypothetical protein [Pseudomonas syringae pv. syringae]
MADAQRPTLAVVGFEHTAQTCLDSGTQLKGLGNRPRHLAMHNGQRRGLMHGVHLLTTQRQVEHGAAAIDVVAQQIRKTLGVGGAAGPAQQGHLFSDLQVLTLPALGLRQHPRQCGNAPGMTQWLPHAEVTDLGNRRQCPTQRDVQLQRRFHEKGLGVG